MAALKKGMGIGIPDVKGTKLPYAAAATDATSIQLRLALIILVRKLPSLPAWPQLHHTIATEQL